MKFSGRIAINLTLAIAAAICVWLFPMQIGSVTQVSVRVENSMPEDTCLLLYSRGIDGDKFQSVIPSRVVAGRDSVFDFKVSPKMPLRNLRITCDARDSRSRVVSAELSYLGIVTLHRWAFPSPFFSLTRVQAGGMNQWRLENLQPIAGVYAAFPQNYPVKMFLIALVGAILLLTCYPGFLKVSSVRSCADNKWLNRLVPGGLAIIFITCTLIASASQEDSHPDEQQHLSATRYYMTHWLPPRIDDPQNAGLYDHYGMTRLNSLGVEYFLAGKLAVLMTFLGASELLACRFFNPFLLIVLVAVSFLLLKKGSSLPLVLPVFFLTPQVWYTFSYMNDDGFPYFLTILFVILFLREQAGRPVLKGMILGLLVISKANFLVFVFFIGVVSLIEILRSRKNFRHWALLFTVAAGVVILRGALDIGINGAHRGEKIIAANEKYAAMPFKLSTAEKNPQAAIWLKAMRKKGVPARELLFHYNWLPLTAASFIAVYGYYTIAAPGWYYAYMGVLLIAFAAYLSAAIWSRRQSESALRLVLALAFLLFITGLAFYRSWDFEFQPQGRHLFPFLAIGAWLVYMERESLRRSVMNGFFVLLFLGGFYSIAGTAIPALLAGR